MSGDLDLPFERQPITEQTFTDGLVSGGLIVMAGVIADPAGPGKLPVLIYRFAKPDGSGFYTPLVLVLDEDGMTKCAQLVASATAAAISEASQ